MKAQTKMKHDLVDITKREIQVLDFMARGSSSKQIAQDLCISEHTVVSHRKNLLRKLEARNTAHLIFKSVRYGFLI